LLKFQNKNSDIAKQLQLQYQNALPNFYLHIRYKKIVTKIKILKAKSVAALIPFFVSLTVTKARKINTLWVEVKIMRLNTNETSSENADER
jgi:hypothetical protein